MTLVIGIQCNNGVVIGADRLVAKLRGTEIKDFETKIVTYSFGDGRKILISHAGARQDARRALSRIDPKNYALREGANLIEYLENVVEPALSSFYRGLLDARGREPDYSFAIGCIDPDNTPVLATVYANGSFDIEPISTMGVGAPFAELILKDVNIEEMDLTLAKCVIGFIIGKVSFVHPYIDGITKGMDIFSLNVDTPKEVGKLTNEELQEILDCTHNISFQKVIETIKEKIRK